MSPTPNKKHKLEKPLTEVELEIMNIIWEMRECTVKDVQVELVKTRELAYTSIATMMKILEQKGVLNSSKSGFAHTYVSILSRQEYEASSLRHLTNNLFHGDPSSMVMRLLDESKISKEDLRAIQKMIDERLGSRS